MKRRRVDGNDQLLEAVVRDTRRLDRAVTAQLAKRGLISMRFSPPCFRRWID